MLKNVSAQSLSVFCFGSDFLPKTGDAANLTAYVNIDGVGPVALADTSAAEDSASLAPGYYTFALTADETNGAKLVFTCNSATSGVTCICVPAVAYPEIAGTVTGTFNPLDDTGNTTLIAGDDYTNNGPEDRRLTYTISDYTGNVTGATTRWKAVRRDKYDRNGSATAELTITSGTVALSAGVLTFRIPVTAAQTAALGSTVTNTSTANYKITLSLIGSGGEVLTQLLVDGYVLKPIA